MESWKGEGGGKRKLANLYLHFMHAFRFVSDEHPLSKKEHTTSAKKTGKNQLLESEA